MQLCECFASEVRCFERRLVQARKTARAHAHSRNPNLVFKDVQRPMPEPVSTLLIQHKSQVTAVDADEAAVVIDPPCQFDDTKPVVLGTTATAVIHATADKVYLETVQDAQVGQTVSQSHPVGDLDEVFRAFHEQWQKRWCRHDQIPHSHWENLIAFARAHMPQRTLAALDINPALLQAEVAFKKPTAATGMDGVSRKDLQAAGPHMLQSLCNMFDRAASDGAWPVQVITGKVASLAKVPKPAGYRGLPTHNGFQPDVQVLQLPPGQAHAHHGRWMVSCRHPWQQEEPPNCPSLAMPGGPNTVCLWPRPDLEWPNGWHRESLQLLAEVPSPGHGTTCRHAFQPVESLVWRPCRHAATLPS